MEKERRAFDRRGWYRTILCGCISAVFLTLCLLVCAAISERYEGVFVRREISAKLCLLLASLLCGMLSAGKAKQDRLVYALAGEGILSAMILLYGCIRGFGGGWISILLNAGIMFFGAFAGALFGRNPKKLQRGKR